MSSSIMHRCQFCGQITDISTSLVAFIENPHCSQVVFPFQIRSTEITFLTECIVWFIGFWEWSESARRSRSSFWQTNEHGDYRGSREPGTSFARLLFRSSPYHVQHHATLSPFFARSSAGQWAIWSEPVFPSYPFSFNGNDHNWHPEEP